MNGPLDGLRVVELAGLGAAPFAGMMLSDAGADIIRVDRPDLAAHPPTEGAHSDLLNRGRRSVAVDLKHADGVDLVLRLIDRADVVIEGFRPGVAERLGVGPDVCMTRNTKLVYGRMTGWGQEGPMAQAAGHDINYISLAGALGSIGRVGERPVPPLNIVGDFGGGGMLLAYGVLAALLSAERTGQGQVVDAAMVDGTALLMTVVMAMQATGEWSRERGTNLLDSGAHYFEVYETSDGQYLGVGAMEPQFYEELLGLMGLDGSDLPDQTDRSAWPQMKERFAEVFATCTWDQWETIFEYSDACVTPVLPCEAPDHPHNRYRGTFTEVAGVVHLAPAPRFQSTPGRIRRPPPHPGQYGDEALNDWGISQLEVSALRVSGAIR